MRLGRLRDYIILARPGTLIAPAVATVFYSLIALKDVGDIEGFFGYLLTPILPAAVVLVCSNAVSNAINQVFDVEEDRISKNHRPVVSGRITKEQALTFAIAGLVFIIFMLPFTTGAFIMVVGAILLCAVFYSVPPVRTKMRFVWNNLTIAVSRGGLGVVAVYSLFAFPSSPILVLAFVFGVFVFGGNASKDFVDRDADRRAGVRNFVTEYGDGARYVVVSLTMLSHILFVIYAILGLMPHNLVYVGLLIPLCVGYLFSKRSWQMFYIHFALLVIVVAFLW